MESKIVLLSKNLMRTAHIRGAYVSAYAKEFLEADDEDILRSWREEWGDDDEIRANVNRAYFEVDDKKTILPELRAEMVRVVGDDWEDFFPTFYSIVENEELLSQLDDKFRVPLQQIAPLFEEFDEALQKYLNTPYPEIEFVIQPLLDLGVKFSCIYFESRIFLTGGSQINKDMAHSFMQQIINFQRYFQKRFGIRIQALALHNSVFTANMNTSLKCFSCYYTLCHEDNFSCFPTDHILCPKMRVLSLEEKHTIYREQGTTGDKQLLQKMRDPISIVYGLVPGDMIEITRELSLGMPSSQAIAYRYVTNS